MSAVSESSIQRKSSLVGREQAWELRLTRREIEQLRREQDHLDSKAIQRPLTSWERIRHRQIFKDLSALLKRMKAYNAELGL